MMKQMRLLNIFLIVALGLSLVACHGQSKTKKASTTILTVNPTVATKSVYFSGTMTPIKTIPVNSPIDGFITKRLFQYGDQIKKGQLLFIIHSAKQKESYQNDLTDYLKAKYQESSAQGKLKVTEALYKRGYESQDNYEQAKTDYYFAHLAFIQAETKLLTHGNMKDLLNLSLNDIDRVSHILEMADQATSIQVTAPSDGIALFAKNTTDDSREAKIGDEIKQNQILVNIGDMTGLSFQIQADEVNVNQLQVGQEATITSPTLPNISLSGKITHIDQQAINTYDAVQFFITILVPNLTPEQQSLIRIGTTAKIAVILKQQAQLLIPTNAVSEDGDHWVVKKIDPITKKITPVTVSTGTTTMDSVAITSGLKAGDQIVVPH